MTWVARIAAACAFFVFVQVVLGAVVRLTGSGLSCPDWPLCYGMWLPTPSKLAALPDIGYTYAQVMSEWIHRLNAAAIVGPLVLALAVLAWRQRRRIPEMMSTAGWALGVLAVQGLLGGITVLGGNSPWSVAAHLVAALVLLALVLRVHMLARGSVGTAVEREVGRFALVVTLLVLFTVASGAVTAKSGATLACASWPLCNGALVPGLDDPLVRYNFGHRLLALGTAITVLALWLIARRLDAGRRGPLARGANMVLATLVLQVLVGAGAMAAFLGGSLPLQVVAGAGHQALGVVLFASLSVMLWRAQAQRAPVRGGAADVPA
jgi:cytochrome c oxidase assembly protein subunit 15